MAKSREDISEKIRKMEDQIDSIKKMWQHYIKDEKDFQNPTKNKMDKRETKMYANLSSKSFYLLELPESLRITMLAMYKLREANTTDVAKETGRSRSAESIHLNQLERMHHLTKIRRGKVVYFRFQKKTLQKMKLTLG